MKKTIIEKIFDILIKLVMIFVVIITLYPFIYVLSMSLSEPINVVRRSVWLFPKGLSFEAYITILENQRIWLSYYNTIWYTVVGTIINIIMTIIAAYPLSKKKFCLQKIVMIMITFTMFFGGGLIPLFILINRLGLYDTRWVMVLPNAVGVWYIIIARTFFLSIPDSLEESAKLDGANDITVLLRIVLPLSKAMISVLTLFYAVGHWNSFFSAMLFLPTADLQPLQIFLRNLLVVLSPEMAQFANEGIDRAFIIEPLKYSTIIVAIIPIICVYPFLQKHFVKGVMIGSLKG